MGILLKIVCIETNLIQEHNDDLFLEQRKKLAYQILDKFLNAETGSLSSVFDSKASLLELPDSISILMNGAAFFRYLIKDMNVIDTGITGLIKEPSLFLDKALSPVFEVQAELSGLSGPAQGG